MRKPFVGTILKSWLLALGLGTGLGEATGLRAQDTTAVRLGSRIRVTFDERVLVASASGRVEATPKVQSRTVAGIFSDLADEAIVLDLDGGGSRRVGLAQIERIEVRGIRRNAVIGSTLGSLLGLAVGVAIGVGASEGDPDCSREMWGGLCDLEQVGAGMLGGLIGALVGGGIGAGIGSAIKTEHWLEADRARLRPNVAMKLDPGGSVAVSVGATLRF